MENISFGRADLHIHTRASDGVATVREVLDHVEQATNLDVIAITDHDRVDAALWAYEHRDQYTYDIIPGVEVSSAAGHILGLWVFEPIPMGLSLEETVAHIHRQGGLAIIAHPYHVHIGIVARNAVRFTRRPDVLMDAGIDGIEVHNAGILLPGANMAARFLGHYLGIAVTGSSDAHTLGAIGHGITRFAGATADDLRHALEHNLTAAEGDIWPVADYWNYVRNSAHNETADFLWETEMPTL